MNVRRCLAAATMIALPPAAAAAPLEPFEVWGRFVETSSVIVSPHTLDTVEIERAAEPGFGSAEVWLLARTKVTDSDRGRQTEKFWADSRSCPQLIPTLAKLADVEGVAIQPPGRAYPIGRDIDPAAAQRLRRSGQPGDRTLFDGGTYEIDAQGHFPVAHMTGAVTMTSGNGTPVSAWVFGAFQALEPCWRTTDPTVHGPPAR
jgi:hypothetical protein